MGNSIGSNSDEAISILQRRGEPASEIIIDSITEALFESGLLFTLSNSSYPQILDLDKLEIIDGNLEVNITLCPLYAANASDQVLLGMDDEIEESRVFIKLEYQQQVLKVIKEALINHGVGLRCNFTFADRGVIMNSGQMSRNDLLDALSENRRMYESFMQEHLPEIGIEWTMQTYSDIYPEFDLVIETDSNIEGADIVADLKDRYGWKTKSIRSRVRSLGNIAGGVIRQYTIFDDYIAWANPGALTMYLERSPIYLTTLNELGRTNRSRSPRIEVLCIEEC